MIQILQDAGGAPSGKSANQSKLFGRKSWHSLPMRMTTASILFCILLPLAATAQQQRDVYSWVDDEGIRHYGDSIPPEYADKPKEVLNEQGVAVDQLQGKKTAEQLAAEERERELELQQELQRRADQTLLATYVNIDEIVMHRDRRVELFQAQARVTELYLRNLARRLDQLKREAGQFKPYSADPNAKPIDPNLVAEIDETEDAIDRHEQNLGKFRQEEQEIIQRFEGDIERFRILKGLNKGAGPAVAPATRAATTSLAQIAPE